MSVDAVTNGVAQPSMDAANVAAPIPAPAPAPATASAPAPAPSVTPASTAAHEATAVNAPAEAPKFSWLKPHPIFVIILVGPEEQPFGLQKDFLCYRSGYYRRFFAENQQPDAVEYVVKLPDSSAEVFGLAQHFLFTGDVISDETGIPSYESLVQLWNLGHRLDIAGLCDRTLEAMIECRRLTERIPATPLLVQVWRDAPEGSSIRRLLLSWTAEYMRSSAARAEFAKSLPQEVLSELVVTMSSFDKTPLVSARPAAPAAAAQGQGQQPPRKNVHYLEGPDDEETLNNTKRNRRSSGMSSVIVRQDSASKQRTPLQKPQKRRSGALEGRTFPADRKLAFCADLLTRMLSGPGFWTRLVGPFRDPVVPAEDGVPDYFDKVKKPMDLMTIKAKMDGGDYGSDDEFAGDVRQIFENCFIYWKKGTPMYEAGERLQKTFEDKFSHMNKWIVKMEDE